jgi:hypothetical protein
MDRRRLDSLLSEIRAAREQTLKALVDMTEEEFTCPTPLQRWDDARRLLLRFGDHMREHANQVAGARDAVDRGWTMPQRMLAEGELAWGKLLGTTVGLSDADIVLKPPDGGWSVQEVLEHVLKVEKLYLESILKARESGPAGK